jgi:hypothetical protein
MADPFKCPQCGSTDYTIVLTGCNVSGATLQESFAWDAESSSYGSSGTLIVESEVVENDGGQAICTGCEADVSEAVQAYEAAQPACES